MNFLKKAALATAISAISINLAHADDRVQRLEKKIGAGMFITTVAAAVVAGPVGIIAATIGGAYLGEKSKTNLENTIALENSMESMIALESEVYSQELEIEKLEKMIEEKMQFQMLFETGADQLAQDDQEQLKAIADFLADSPYMHISIDGHADPRGSEEYNNILSQERAKSVENILVDNGVESYRISAKGHGSKFSSGELGNLEQYASDRKVKVQIVPSKAGTSLAAIE